MDQRESANTHPAGDPAMQLLSIVNGSWMTQAAHAAARLQIPDLLADGPRNSTELAAAIGAHAPSLFRLMRALVAIDLCTEGSDGSFALTPMGSLLRTDAPNSLRAWTLYWAGPAWSTWSNLAASVMTGQSARVPPAGGDAFTRLETDPAAAALFNRAMVELTRLDATNIARACDLSDINSLVDVGGGYGELLAVLLTTHRHLTGILFDRPHALEAAHTRLAAAMVEDRCEFATGDFFVAVPAGADVYLLKSIIHDWNDDRARTILTNCRQAMHDRSRLLLVERIMPTHLQSTPAHRSSARSDLNMLVGLGGMERTEDEYRELLRGAGLRLNTVVAAGPTFCVIDARRAS